MGTISKNDFEGQTNGVVPDTSNSAASGTAFSAVSVSGTNYVIEYSTAQAAHGSCSMHVQNTAGGGKAHLRFKTFPSNVKQGRFRFYVRIVSGPSSGAAAIGQVADTSGAAIVNILLNSASQLGFQNRAGATQAYAGTKLNTWYRVEIGVTVGTSNTTGNIAIAVYEGDSTTAAWTYTYANTDAGTTAIATLWLGKTGTSGAAELYIDDIAQEDGVAGPEFGPAVVATPPAETVGVASVTTNTDGWQAQGAVDIPAALVAPGVDSRGVASPDGASGSALTVRLAPLTKAPVSLAVELSATATPATATMSIWQGSTKVAEGPAWQLTTTRTRYVLTLTADQRAAITQLSAVDVRITVTA